MATREDFKVVLDDLMKWDLFVGKFDAVNGNKDFMFGIETVMKAIALRASDEAYDNYVAIFTRNYLDSLNKRGKYNG